MNTKTVSLASTLQISTVSGSDQATGAFDYGRITERKPIGMPHDRAAQQSIGPLFYWAWAQSEEKGTIALHPHQGFEILSYVLEGELNHRDTLNNRSCVGVGGAQVQQAGSGLSHEEITGDDPTGFFQIWFQPDLEKALKRAPTYGEYSHQELPVDSGEGVSAKTILGPGSPIQLETRAEMRDITVIPGGSFVHEAKPGHAFIMVTIEGEGQLSSTSESSSERVSAHDCTVITAAAAASEAERVTLMATGAQDLRFVAVEVPLETGYPLYR